jgi:hypothetical protein
VLTDHYNFKEVCALSEDFMLVKGKGHIARAESHCTVTIHFLSSLDTIRDQRDQVSAEVRGQRIMNKNCLKL